MFVYIFSPRANQTDFYLVLFYIEIAAFQSHVLNAIKTDHIAWV